MLGAQGQPRAGLGDTLIAAAVLLVLIAGWTEGLGSARLERLWALASSFVSGPPQLRSDNGPLRNGVYSASSLPAAST